MKIMKVDLSHKVDLRWNGVKNFLATIDFHKKSIFNLKNMDLTKITFDFFSNLYRLQRVAYGKGFADGQILMASLPTSIDEEEEENEDDDILSLAEKYGDDIDGPDPAKGEVIEEEVVK